MVKSAVRAMDTVQKYCQDEWSVQLDAFTITGGSKRGWTTWLTGAVDERATAIAPMVIDTLNMQPQMKHQLESWGSYSDEIDDYTSRGLQKHMNTEAGRALTAIVDPYSYREVLTQPKLIMMGTNDNYWPLDALNLYWDDLAGEKYILYVPNNGHGLRDYPRVIGSFCALHQHIANGKKLPKLSWSFVPNGDKLTLRVQSDQAPKSVHVWLAQSSTRDFRQAEWKSNPTRHEDAEFVYDLAFPQSGYAAMFGEAVYADGILPSYLSTNVRIVDSDEVLTVKEGG
jgi:PhoPQ-activated pathogenicity-related protein